MLTPREAFKVGFLSRCVEEGLDLGQIQARVKEATDKLAFDPSFGLYGTLKDLATPVVKTIADYGVPAMLAAPPIVGGLAGYAASKMSDVSDLDIKDIKRHELIDELQRQTQRLQMERATRDLQANNRRRRPASPFL